MPGMEIRDARFPEELETVRTLFLAYEAGLGVSLCFQSFDREVATLPGKYARPSGRLLVACPGPDAPPAGCVALRDLGSGVCEMKRLYLDPSLRGAGAGRALVTRLLDEARAAGYAAMRLDTLADRMPAAVSLYRSLGFREIAPYNDHPVEGTLFMELAL